MAKKSKMDRGLDSLFFDNSIDEIARSDSESVKNDDGENGISMEKEFGKGGSRFSWMRMAVYSSGRSLLSRLTTALNMEKMLWEPKTSRMTSFCHRRSRFMYVITSLIFFSA